MQTTLSGNTIDLDGQTLRGVLQAPRVSVSLLAGQRAVLHSADNAGVKAVVEAAHCAKVPDWLGRRWRLGGNVVDNLLFLLRLCLFSLLFVSLVFFLI